jgi:hypothetical protein
VQDNIWLPSNFLARTIAFYANGAHPRDVLLSYPERRVAPPDGRLSRDLMNETSVVAHKQTRTCKQASTTYARARHFMQYH